MFFLLFLTSDRASFEMEGIENSEIIIGPSYEFVKNGKSKNGILTIDDIWRYHYTNKSRKGDTEWYNCINKKKNSCGASVTVVLAMSDEDNTETRHVIKWPKNPFDEHADTCIPDKGRVLADKMMNEMKAAVESDPSIPLAKQKDNIKLKWKISYEREDPELWQDIKRNLPSDEAIVKRLSNTRLKVTGPIPNDRDNWDPSSFLSKVPGGDKILVFDSKTDLPASQVEKDALIKRAFNGSTMNDDSEDENCINLLDDEIESGREGNEQGA